MKVGEDLAQVPVAVEVLGLDRDRLLEEGKCFLLAPFDEVDRAQVVQGDMVPVSDPEREAVQGLAILPDHDLRRGRRGEREQDGARAGGHGYRAQRPASRPGDPLLTRPHPRQAGQGEDQREIDADHGNVGVAPCQRLLADLEQADHGNEGPEVPEPSHQEPRLPLPPAPREPRDRAQRHRREEHRHSRRTLGRPGHEHRQPRWGHVLVEVGRVRGDRVRDPAADRVGIRAGHGAPALLREVSDHAAPGGQDEKRNLLEPRPRGGLAGRSRRAAESQPAERPPVHEQERQRQRHEHRLGGQPQREEDRDQRVARRARAARVGQVGMAGQEPERRAEDVLALRSPRHRLDVERVQAEERPGERRRPERGPSEEPGDAPREPEDEEHVEHVERQVDEMVREGRLASQRPDHLVAVPGERHPVGAVEGGPGPGECSRREAAVHDRVLDDERRVVVAHEVVADDRGVGERNRGREQQAHPEGLPGRRGLARRGALRTRCVLRPRLDLGGRASGRRGRSDRATPQGSIARVPGHGCFTKAWARANTECHIGRVRRPVLVFWRLG